MSHQQKKAIIEKYLNVKLIPAKEHNPELQGWDGWNNKYIICQADGSPLEFNDDEDKTHGTDHGTEKMYIHSRPNDHGNLLITLKYWCKDNDDIFEYRQRLCTEAKRVKMDEAFVIGGPEESLILTKGQINRIASGFRAASPLAAAKEETAAADVAAAAATFVADVIKTATDGAADAPAPAAAAAALSAGSPPLPRQKETDSATTIQCLLRRVSAKAELNSRKHPKS